MIGRNELLLRLLKGMGVRIAKAKGVQKMAMARGALPAKAARRARRGRGTEGSEVDASSPPAPREKG